ncbi:MAG: ROK family transcriptional regulator [Rhodospirillaceae bacterium]
MTSETRNRFDLGRTNRRVVLGTVVLNGPLPRTEIANATGLTPAAISRITRDLIDAGLLIELPNGADDHQDDRRGPGRRFVHLDVNADGGYVLGIGVNVFAQSVTLADLKNRRIARQDLKLSDLTDPDRVIDALTRVAKDMTARHVPDRRRLLGACVAFTGAVDPVSGVVRTSPYLRWGEVALGARIERALGMPVHIENLNVALAQAESRFGIARGITNMLTVNCSLGIGASLFMDGRVARGHDCSAGLIGGMVPPGGDGQTLDMVAGGHAVLKTLHGDTVRVPEKPSNELADMLLAAIDRANAGDAQARAAFADAGGALGRTLRHFAELLRPEAVAIAGPVTNSPDYIDACRGAIAGGPGAYAPAFLTSGLSPQGAARWVAIDEFLLERDLNLDDLKLSKAA